MTMEIFIRLEFLVLIAENICPSSEVWDVPSSVGSLISSVESLISSSESLMAPTSHFSLGTVPLAIEKAVEC